MSERRVVYPLRDVVLFPGQRETFRDMRLVGAAAVSLASELAEPVVCLTQTDPRVETPVAAELFTAGTLARIVGGEVRDYGAHWVELEGVRRVEVTDVRYEGDCLRATTTPLVTRGPAPDDRLMDDLLRLAREARGRVPRLFPKDYRVPPAADDPERLLDELAAAVSDEYARPPKKMKVLDKQDPSDRARVLKFLFKELLERRPDRL